MSKVRALWTTSQVVTTSPAGQRMTTIFKLTHPSRRQKLIIIPCPRLGTPEFYKDWIYQPYAKEHMLYISSDLFNFFYIPMARVAAARGKFPGITYFRLSDMPDSIDMNLTRFAAHGRERPIKTRILQTFLMSTEWRERRHPYVIRQFKRIVGERYTLHPQNEKDGGSFVFLLPPGPATSCLNVALSLGFVIAESVEAPVGNGERLDKLHQHCVHGQTAAICYLWASIMIVVCNEVLRFYNSMIEFRDDYYAKREKFLEQAVADGQLTGEALKILKEQKEHA